MINIHIMIIYNMINTHINIIAPIFCMDILMSKHLRE